MSKTKIGIVIAALVIGVSSIGIFAYLAKRKKVEGDSNGK